MAHPIAPTLLSGLLVAALAAPAAQAKTRAGGKTIPAKTQIQVLSTGQAPRRRIRYRFRAGQRVRLKMSMKMAMGMQLGPRRLPARTLPTIEMGMRIHVLKVAPGGNATLEFRVSAVTVKKDAALPAASHAQFVRAVKAIKGFRGSSVVSPRGIALKTSYQVPPGLPQQSRQIVQSLQRQMKQLTAQLPAKPVGVGARWRVRIPIQGPPLRMVSEMTYKLRGLSARSARVSVQLGGYAPPQNMQLSNVPGGATARIQSLSVSGAGKLRLHLREPKASGQLRARQSMDMEIHVMGRARRMKMNMRMTITTR